MSYFAALASPIGVCKKGVPSLHRNVINQVSESDYTVQSRLSSEHILSRVMYYVSLLPSRWFSHAILQCFPLDVIASEVVSELEGSGETVEVRHEF